MSEELAPEDRGGALAARSRHELELAEQVVIRRNRRWLTVMFVPALFVGGIAIAAAVVAGQQTSSVSPLSVPAGYKAVSDGTYAYAVPSSWQESAAYSDDVGDLDTQGTSGWAAEHLGTSSTPPSANEKPPTSFEAFGEPAPRPYSMSAAVPYQVSGANVSYRYQMSRPGGFSATAIDAWQASSGDELWFLVDAPPSTTATILSTLRAG